MTGEKVSLKLKRDDKINEVTVGEQSRPSRRISEIGSGGRAIVTHGFRSEIWYFDPESKKVMLLAVNPIGAVWKDAYTREMLEKDEYSTTYEITTATGKKGAAVFHTKWNGSNEFTTWTSDRVIPGDEGRATAAPLRQTFGRVQDAK